MHASLKLGTIFGMMVLALCVPLGAKAQSLRVHGYSRANYFPIGEGYELEGPTSVSASDDQNFAFRSDTGEFAGSTYEKISATADYGTLHAFAYSDLNSVDPGVYGPLETDSHSDAYFNDSVYLAPTAGQPIGTPITLSARMDITASLTAVGSGTGAYEEALYLANFTFGSQGIHVDDTLLPDQNFLTGSSTGTFDAFIGDTVSLEGQLSAQSDTFTTTPGEVLAKADIGNTAHFYLSAPGVSIIGMSGHDYAAPAAVPEASPTVSFGLLLALGIGGVMIAARKKKTAASA